MHESDPNPEQLKQALCRDGVWHQNSFTFITRAMHGCRPALCLYYDARYHADRRSNMNNYENLIDMACEYTDAMNYPWIKTKLKNIVWVYFREFYDTLAHLVRDNIKKMPLSAHDQELMNALATIWVKVGTFTDEHDITPLVANENKM